MTLQQLKYVSTVAKCGSISKAAQMLFVSQPSISTMIQALEEELGILIFMRSPMGITLTEEGRELINLSENMLNDAEHISNYFQDRQYHEDSDSLFISSQHYDFVASAFAEYINRSGMEFFKYGLNQTSTAKVIDDVSTRKSDLGIIYIASTDKKLMERVLKDHGLSYHSLVMTSPHVYMAKSHPLADRRKVTTEEINAYPCVLYPQNEDSPAFYSEELIIPGFYPKQVIRVSDLYLSIQMMKRCNAVDIGTGIISKELAEMITFVPLESSTIIDIGYIKPVKKQLDTHEKKFLRYLKKALEQKAI